MDEMRVTMNDLFGDGLVDDGVFVGVEEHVYTVDHDDEPPSPGVADGGSGHAAGQGEEGPEDGVDHGEGGDRVDPVEAGGKSAERVSQHGDCVEPEHQRVGVGIGGHRVVDHCFQKVVERVDPDLVQQRHVRDLDGELQRVDIGRRGGGRRVVVRLVEEHRKVLGGRRWKRMGVGVVDRRRRRRG